MKITRRQLRQIIKETLDPDLLKGAYVSSREDREAFKDYIAKVKAKKASMDDEGSDYPKTVGYTDLKGENQMIIVQSMDDMNAILDLLVAQDIPYSVD